MKTRTARPCPFPVVGLDLSLVGPAALVIPGDWDARDLSRIMVSKLGSAEREAPTSEVERIERLSSIAGEVVDFVARVVGGVRVEDGWANFDPRKILVYVEAYAFSARSSSVTKLAELGGATRVDLLRELGLVPTAVVASSARKTLLQKLPRKDVKGFTERNVRRLQGATYYWSGDVIDAFAVANHGRMLNGWSHMSFPGT